MNIYELASVAIAGSLIGLISFAFEVLFIRRRLSSSPDQRDLVIRSEKQKMQIGLISGIAIFGYHVIQGLEVWSSLAIIMFVIGAFAAIFWLEHSKLRK